jgi:hypothetical protein
VTFQPGNLRARKLTGEQVLTIRERYATERGCTQGQLAREFQVTIGTIASIVKGLTWQGLTRGDAVRRPPCDLPPPPPASDAELASSQDRLLARLKSDIASEGLGEFLKLTGDSE